MVLAEWSWLARLSGRTSYSLIGSVAQAAGPSTIVWGSGILGEQYAQQLQRPQRICSVRGPLTRQIYLDQGIECPAIYGDPALLLPRFYQPQTKKKRYRIGIIAHIYDETNPALMHLRNSEDIAFISMRDSDHWQQVVDQINACELIASSSLHGIIIADAYGVPNGWVELSNRVLGKGFKFRDYFLSVGRPCTEPLQLTAQTTLDELLALRAQWQAPQIDLQPMIEACPLNLLFSQQ
ncbi:MAG: polysaccharide pyruvyl transferase family protein [Bacteroidaceae bacterium]|nr:polysaccharide pyruvyl transferase family protein [Bacteroidaceae bacterium]